MQALLASARSKLQCDLFAAALHHAGIHKRASVRPEEAKP